MMGIPDSLRVNLYFALKGDITYGANTCANWQTARLNQIRSTVNVLTDLNIDAALSLDPEADLLVPFTAADAGVEPLRIRRTIYLGALFFGLFLA